MQKMATARSTTVVLSYEEAAAKPDSSREHDSSQLLKSTINVQRFKINGKGHRNTPSQNGLSPTYKKAWVVYTKKDSHHAISPGTIRSRYHYQEYS